MTMPAEGSVTARPASPLVRILPGLPLRLGIVGTLLLLLAAFASLIWTPHPVDRTDLALQFLDAGGAHLLGTDALGRDVLSLVMKGMLTSYVVATIGVAVGIFIGVPLGVVASVTGGPVSWTVARLVDGLAVVPALAIAALLAVIAGAGAGSAMVAIGIVGIPMFARLSRQATDVLLRSDAVAAARLAGMSLWEAAVRHALPPFRMLLLARAATALAFAMLIEASLAYVGLAAHAGTTSLGQMLREAQGYLVLEPALALVPGAAIVVMAGLLHMIGDRLGRLLDPRLASLGWVDGAA